MNPKVLKQMGKMALAAIIAGPIAKTAQGLKTLIKDMKEIGNTLKYLFTGVMKEPALEKFGADVVEETAKSKSAKEIVGIIKETSIGKIEKGEGTFVRFGGKGKGKIDYVEETGRLGGKHYSEKDMKLLGNYLEKRGVTLKVGDEFLPPGKGGGFNYNTGELVFKSNPTQYEVWHELSHYIQYKQIGKEAYSNLPRTSGPVPMNDLTKFNAPEQFVYEMLSDKDGIP